MIHAKFSLSLWGIQSPVPAAPHLIPLSSSALALKPHQDWKSSPDYRISFLKSHSRVAISWIFLSSDISLFFDCDFCLTILDNFALSAPACLFIDPSAWLFDTGFLSEPCLNFYQDFFNFLVWRFSFVTWPELPTIILLLSQLLGPQSFTASPALTKNAKSLTSPFKW